MTDPIQGHGAFKPSFDKCPRCKVWGWFNVDKPSSGFSNHACPPAWEVRDKGEDDDAWRTVYAAEADSAAEKYCDQTDCENDYNMLRAGKGTVEVRRPGADEIVTFEIEAESVPQYSAREV